MMHQEIQVLQFQANSAHIPKHYSRTKPAWTRLALFPQDSLCGKVSKKFPDFVLDLVYDPTGKIP